MREVHVVVTAALTYSTFLDVNDAKIAERVKHSLEAEGYQVNELEVVRYLAADKPEPTPRRRR